MCIDDRRIQLAWTASSLLEQRMTEMKLEMDRLAQEAALEQLRKKVEQ